MNNYIDTIERLEVNPEFRIYEVLPIVRNALEKRKESFIISIYDDKKEKRNSFEATINITQDISRSDVNGFGVLDINISGYGEDEEEALEDLNKLFIKLYDSFLSILIKENKL